MRYFSIDILRTIAIFVMVFVHFGENLAGYASPIAGFGAPLFAFLSGVSYYLWAKGREAKGVSEQEINKVSIRRGLFVFGTGIAFNVLVWLPEDTFNWDVLTFIGSALVMLSLVRHLPRVVLLVAAAMAVLISPLLRLMCDYESFWLNLYFDPDMTLGDVFIGYFVAGYFPFFPWVAYSLVGFVVGSLLFVEETSDGASEATVVEAPFPWPFVVGGIVLSVLSATLLLTRSFLPTLLSNNYLGEWKMFPPTVIYVSGTLGLTLLLVAFTHFLIDRNFPDRVPSGLADIAKTFSRYSLTIYILHHVAHLYPLWCYAISQGQEPTYYWKEAMTAPQAWGLAVVFLLLCYGLLRILGSKRTYGLESAMRWVCD